jgi:hypothetical protein
VQLRLQLVAAGPQFGELHSRVADVGQWLRLGFAHVPQVGRGLAVLLRLGSGVNSLA